jgi:uncharacterized protein (DUF1697 family)
MRAAICATSALDTGGMLWLGLVRNVMVGRDGLSRDVLVDVLNAAGAADARSHLATGNVTFRADREEVDAMVTRVETGLEQVVGRSTMCAVRPVTWLHRLIADDRFAPFDGDWETEVGFLRHDAPVLDRAGLGDARRTVVVEVLEREVLTARPRAGGARPHVNRLLEVATGSPATARGWSTLQRIAAATPAD